MEIEQSLADFKRGKLSATDAFTFLDYLYDEMGTDTHKNVYHAYEELYITVGRVVLLYTKSR
jgi:hypothetical protein